ncbi:hypothetical protein GC096_30460 [Paenibacillus sp. LMG 31461]|uniref:Uncharacterized protein n=1 Tax=Paenibacillus plantarum TaxID=2654975 RepID=A0ABX1XII2_9BACL|nr:hypothetical protein [Paenibacillus plantarum]NOU68353.1 hypothetical protein [Paenibacillus plantarum]
MPQILVSKDVGFYAHLSKLYSYLEALRTNPGYFHKDVRPAAEDWLRGAIAALEKELYGIEKEAATGQGDYFKIAAFENNIASSIPAEQIQFKDSFFCL